MQISPYVLGNKKACTYCAYYSVCGFDPKIQGYEYRRLKKFTDEELWEAFNREVE